MVVNYTNNQTQCITMTKNDDTNIILKFIDGICLI